MPKLYIIAGPNGSGKTTFAKEFLPHFAKCSLFVNADLIAQGLSPFSPATVGLKAGRLLLEEINHFVDKRLDFALESTLAGKTYLTLIKKMKIKGYSVRILFLWIPDPGLAKERIKQRVKNGGHNVPADDIVRRFKRSMNNFVEYYQALCDAWVIVDNSGEVPSPIAEYLGSRLYIYREDILKQYFPGAQR